MKKNIFLGMAAVAFVAACHSSPTSKTDQHLISSMSYPVSNGWAYRILIDKKVFIQQEFMPAVSGTRAFPSKESADAIALLVVEKIKRNEKPVVSPEDLVKAGAVR